MNTSRPLNFLIATAVVVGLVAAPASSASADSCSSVTLSLVVDWPADVGMTARWGSYSAELRHPPDQTAPPFIYRGEIVVPLSAYSGAWSYRVTLGQQQVFDSGSSFDTVALGAGSCTASRVVHRSPSDLTVRAFIDPTGTGDVDPFAAPFYEGAEGAVIRICQLSLTSQGCVPGSEALLGSPRVARSENDFTASWGGLRGRYRVWADAPQRYLRTYPTPSSTPLDCGAASNGCSASQAQWTVDLRGGGSIWLDLGLAATIRNGTPLQAH